MENRAQRLNSLLVQLFNDILHIEEKVLKSSEIKDLSITRESSFLSYNPIKSLFVCSTISSFIYFETSIPLN